MDKLPLPAAVGLNFIGSIVFILGTVCLGPAARGFFLATCGGMSGNSRKYHVRKVWTQLVNTTSRLRHADHRFPISRFDALRQSKLKFQRQCLHEPPCRSFQGPTVGDTYRARDYGGTFAQDFFRSRSPVPPLTLHRDSPTRTRGGVDSRRLRGMFKRTAPPDTFASGAPTFLVDISEALIFYFSMT
jgi:hypothetical protein